MKALKSLAIFNSVRLVWVPGLGGIEGNERVDLLAKQASSLCFTGPEPSVYRYQYFYCPQFYKFVGYPGTKWTVAGTA